MSQTEPNPSTIVGFDSDLITTIVDDGVEIVGGLICRNGKDILVSGIVNGDIFSNGGVVINQSGIVRGSVRASRVKLLGLIERPDGKETEVIGTSLVSISKTGRLTASVLSYGDLDIEFGSYLAASMNPLAKNQGGAHG